MKLPGEYVFRPLPESALRSKMLRHVHVNWHYDAPLYAVLFLVLLLGFSFAEPGTPFAAFTVAVFLFWTGYLSLCEEKTIKA